MTWHIRATQWSTVCGIGADTTLLADHAAQSDCPTCRARTATQDTAPPPTPPPTAARPERLAWALERSHPEWSTAGRLARMCGLSPVTVRRLLPDVAERSDVAGAVVWRVRR